MENQITFEVTREEDGGYSAKAFGYGIFTQGDTWEELLDMARDAVKCHFSDEPTVKTVHLVFEQLLPAF